jgi:gamma-glutamyltranspeptidase/glutathione hydrolase
MTRNRREVLAGLAGGMALAHPLAAFGGDRPIGPAFAGRSTVYARGGMVATSQPLATAAGLDMLRAGGTAVDAAIAANITLGLVEPTGSGMGGDLFAIVYDPATQELHGLNASGPAPLGQSLEQLRTRIKGARQIPPVGAAPINVPGAVDGWAKLHGKFGKRPWASLFAPAMHCASDGFPMSPVIANAWDNSIKLFLRQRADLEEFDNAMKTYTIDGVVPKAGQIMRNPDLARSFKIVAEGGRDAYYKGPIAATIDAYFRRIGGPLRRSDLAAYQAERVSPITTVYRDVRVAELPPNGQGIAVLQMLNILEGFDLRAMGFGSADALHVQIEAKKLAFADRAKLIADPRFAKVPVAELLSRERAAKQRAMIRMDAVLPATPEPLATGDTIYLSTADASGMVVSLIQSNFRGMGSGLVADGLGFMFQDRGQQFSLDPNHANVYAPGKRPFHTIIPAFATKGATRMAFGVMGGSMQPQGHVQIITNLTDFGFDLQEAGDAPRWRHLGGMDVDGMPTDGDTDGVYLERAIDDKARTGLAARGHKLVTTYQDVGGYQAAAHDSTTGVIAGASEMRKDGLAMGL